MNLVDCITGLHGLADDKHALVGRLAQGFVDVGNLQDLVLQETVHALSDHTQALLDGFLEGTADGHNLADRLHGRTQFAVNALELAQIPAGNLADNIVECRLEEGRSGLGYRVLEFEQTVTQTQLGSHESQRIAGSLGGQRRRTRQAGIDLDDAVVFGIRVEGVLYVTFAHNADMADNLDGELAQLVVVAVRERLRRSHYDTLAGVDAQRVEVLHVADRDAVVVLVAHHLIFHFLPAFQALLDQNLGREAQCLVTDDLQFFLIVTEAGTQTAQCVCRTDNDRISEVGGSLAGFVEGIAGVALDGVDVDLVQLLNKQLTVFGIHDGLYGRSQNLYVVLLEYAALIQLYAAVQGGLSAKAQQDAVRTLLGNYFLHKERGDGQEVNAVGNTFAGLHSGNVRVNQDAVDTLFLQGFQGLTAGIVELAGFTDFQRSGTQEQYFLNLIVYHNCTCKPKLK